MRFFVPLLIFFTLIFFLYRGLSLDPRKMDSTLIDQIAPTFSLPEVADTKLIFSEQKFKGKVSLFNVWASWCVACRQEHPLLMQLSKQPNISLYGLNWKDELSDARGWLNQHGNPYVASGFDHDGRTGIDYGVTGTPETFIIDKQGRVRHKHVGPISVKIFTNELWPLMQELEKEPS